MEILLHIGLSNAALATLLAVLAAFVGAISRRPALAHGLWLVALLKLVTPPLVDLPVLPAGAGEVAATLPALEPLPEPVAVELPQPLVGPELPADEPEPGEMPEPAMLAFAGSTSLAALEEIPEPQRVDASRWPALALAFWLAGSAAWFVLAAVRIRRFHALLHQARRAPREVQARVRVLAKRLGLGSCPETRLVAAAVSPMLWAVGRGPLLLLPDALWDRLSPAQQDALLVHELAHLRRRDHWVRGLELLVTGLYWWHPAVWWARHGLREAEEQCCDAWVVWALPAAAKAYALALLETVDFLSGARPALPPTASGAGQVRILKRRLTMIMQGTTPRALSAAGLLGVLAVGAVLLPLVPTWAQPPAPPAPPGERRIEIEIRKPGDPANADDARAEVKRLAAYAELLRHQLHMVEEQLEAAKKKLAAIPAPGDERKENVKFLFLRGEGAPAKLLEEVKLLETQVKVREAKVEEATARLQLARDVLARQEELSKKQLVSADEVAKARTEVKVYEAQLRGAQAEREEIQVRLGQLKKVAEDVKAGAKFERPVPPPPVKTPPAVKAPPAVKTPAANADDRMKEMERRLDDLMRAMEELRKEMKKPATPPPGRGAAEPERNPPADDVKGRVKEVDPETGLVIVDRGSDVGLSKGHTLDVYRLKPAPAFVGILRIVEVREKESVGKLIQQKSAPQAGDEAASQTIRNR